MSTCETCNGTGEVITERAHQAYSPARGTYIEDDRVEPCPDCKRKPERDPDDYDEDDR
jgi:hypothetical protein